MTEQAQRLLNAVKQPAVHLNADLWEEFKNAFVSYIHMLEGEAETAVKDVEHVVDPTGGQTVATPTGTDAGNTPAATPAPTTNPATAPPTGGES